MEVLSSRQVERIRNKMQQGEEVYVDIEGNIEPQDFNVTGLEAQKDWIDIEEEERRNESIDDVEDAIKEMSSGPEVTSETNEEEEVEFLGTRLGATIVATAEQEGENTDFPTPAEALRMTNGGRKNELPGGVNTQRNGTNHQNSNPTSGIATPAKRQTALSWSGAAQGAKFQTDVAPTQLYDTRFRVEMSFDMKTIPEENSTEEQQTEGLILMMKALTKRLKQVVNKFAIMPWKTGDRYKAIESSKDIPTNMMMMRKYIRHEEEKDGRPYRRGFRYGRNAKWRVNLNFKRVSGEEFLHYWNESKKTFDTANYITLKPAAMQAENSYGLGSFMNSGEKQFTDENSKGLTKILGWEVELSFRDVPATYSTIDGFWKEARYKGGRNMKEVYALAPQAITVHCKASSVAVRNNLVNELQRRYGGHDELGRYNQGPDGTRMRFVPAENRTPMIQRHMLKKLIATQIQLKSNAHTIDFPYEIDRSATFNNVPSTNGKTLGKLIFILHVIFSSL